MQSWVLYRRETLNWVDRKQKRSRFRNDQKHRYCIFESKDTKTQKVALFIPRGREHYVVLFGSQLHRLIPGPKLSRNINHLQQVGCGTQKVPSGRP